MNLFRNIHWDSLLVLLLIAMWNRAIQALPDESQFLKERVRILEISLIR